MPVLGKRLARGAQVAAGERVGQEVVAERLEQQRAVDGLLGLAEPRRLDERVAVVFVVVRAGAHRLAALAGGDPLLGGP